MFASSGPAPLRTSAPAPLHETVAQPPAARPSATRSRPSAAARRASTRAFDAAVTRLLGLEGRNGHHARRRQVRTRRPEVAATFRSIGLPAVFLSPTDSLHGDLGGSARTATSRCSSPRAAPPASCSRWSRPALPRRGLIAVVGSPTSPSAPSATSRSTRRSEREGCPLDVAPMASVRPHRRWATRSPRRRSGRAVSPRDDFARLHPAGALGARLTLTVHDVMRAGSELPRVDAGASLKQAILEITDKGYGAVCVTRPDGVARRLHHGRRHPPRAAGHRRPLVGIGLTT